MRSLIISLVVVLVLYFIPSILSFDPLLNYLLSTRKQSVHMQGTALRWLGPQEVADIVIRKEGVEAHATSLLTQTSLFGLITKNFGSTSIQAATVQATAFTTEKQTASQFDFVGTFDIASLLIRVPSAQLKLDTLTYTDTAEEHALYINGECSSKDGAGSLAVAYSSKGPMFSEKGLFKLQAQLSSVPTGALAALGAVTNSQLLTEMPVILGDTLTAQISGDQATDRIGVKIHASSSKLKASLYPVFSSKDIQVQKESELAFRVSKEAWHALHLPYSHYIDAETTLSGSIEKINIPYQKEGIRFRDAAVYGTFGARGGRFSFESVPLSIDDLKLSLASQNLSKSATLTIRGQGVTDQKTVYTLRGKGTIVDPFEDIRIHAIDADISNVPVLFIDSIIKERVSNYLGPYLSGSLKGSENRYTLAVKTPYLHIEQAEFVEDGMGYTTLQSFAMNYLYPHAIEGLSPVSLSANVSSAFIDTTDIYKSALDGTVQIAPCTFSNQKTGIRLSNTSLTFKGDTLKQIAVDGDTVVQVTNASSLIGAAFPRAMQSKLSATLNAKNLTGSISSFSLDAPSAKGMLTGSFSGTGITLKSKGPITLVPALSVASEIVRREYSTAPKLITSSPWQITVDTVSIFNDGMHTIDVTAKTESLSIAAQNDTKQTMLEDVMVVTESKGGSYAVTGSLLADSGRGSLKFEQTGDLLKAQFTMKHIPTKLIDALTQEKYSALLGETVNASGSFMGKSQLETANIHFAAPLASGKGSIAKKQGEYVLTEPSNVLFRLSPEGFGALFKNHSLTLTEPANISMDVRAFSAQQGEGFFPTIDTITNPSSLDARLSCPSFTFVDTSSATPFALKSLTSSVNKESEDTPLRLQAQADVSNGGSLRVSGMLQHFLQDDSTFSLKRADVDLAVDITRFPTAIIDVLFSTEESISPSIFLGEVVSMQGDVKVKQGTGTLSLDLQSPHAKSALSARIASDVAYLNKPIHAKLLITKELNTHLFETMGVTILSLGRPITLDIGDKGFRFPLNNLNISHASIPHGVLDLGQLIASSAGNPEDIATLLERKNRKQQVHLWFAPMDFSIRQGTLDIGRTEILYDNEYDIAIWGTVDLIDQYVKMILGITGQSLQKAFGLRVPREYVLRIPFKGPFHSVKLDRARAAATIASLIAKQRAAQSNDTLSNIFGIIGELADDQSKVPKAKRPFPWEKR